MLRRVVSGGTVCGEVKVIATWGGIGCGLKEASDETMVLPREQLFI
jgi:hypothetical protein